MQISLLGKKLGMTSLFDRYGHRMPVTVIEAGPCTVTAVKESNAKSSVQLGYEDIKEKHVTKPMAGFFKKIKVSPKRYLCEFSSAKTEGLEVGAEIRVDNFHMGDYVDITGTSIGKGFQGVVKRHGYSGGPASHGSKTGRIPGSIGMCATPSRVLKGTKLPGQMGNETVTVQNLKVVSIDLEKNILVVEGSVPGAENGVLTIQDSLKRGAKDKAWKPFTKDSIENWKKEIAEIKAAIEKKEQEAEAKKKAAAAAAAKKAATQAAGRVTKRK
jgi:large subunit ribosomal protein L3